MRSESTSIDRANRALGKKTSESVFEGSLIDSRFTCHESQRFVAHRSIRVRVQKPEKIGAKMLLESPIDLSDSET